MPSRPMPTKTAAPTTRQPMARQFMSRWIGRASPPADLEAHVLAGGGATFGVDLLDAGTAGSPPEMAPQLVQVVRIALGHDRHDALVGVVHHPAGEVQRIGAGADPPPEADPLHPARDLRR